MAYRGLYVACVLCCALMIVSDAVYLPKTRGLAAAEALKRSVQTGARQKRYTDYQERASAFCTGLCMYEERKSYSDCFDLCNWNGHSYSRYSFDDEPEPEAQPLPVQDSDYSNDQAMPGIISSRTGANSKKKGKKGKNKGKSSKKIKNEQLAKQKQILKELKRKLMQEIGEKQDQLSETALTLQVEIQELESQIDYNKQTIGDLMDRLDNIGSEMGNIEELKNNISMLVKDRRKMLSGKTSDGYSESFLLPESEFPNDGNLSSVLKDFLVQDKAKRSEEASLSEEVLPLYSNDMHFANKNDQLSIAASNLKEILPDGGYPNVVV